MSQVQSIAIFHLTSLFYVDFILNTVNSEARAGVFSLDLGFSGFVWGSRVFWTKMGQIWFFFGIMNFESANEVNLGRKSKMRGKKVEIMEIFVKNVSKISCPYPHPSNLFWLRRRRGV